MFAKGLSFFVFVTFLFILTSEAQELRLEEVVSNHTNSIGKSDKRKELKNMVLLGMSEFRSKMPERKSVGKVAIVSDASNLLVISSFLAESYPYEKIGIFDSKINIPFVNAGVRSPLGDFLWEHPGILKSGLFSGSMSLQWSFSEDYAKRGKLSLAGTKKVDGKKAHVVEFYPQGGSESLKIRLFFDAETFQHIRSEYREEYSGKQATFGQLGQVNGYVIQLIESYKDFKTQDDITLPTHYKVQYMGSSSKGTFEYEWIFKLNEIQFNQPLKEGFFNF